MLRYILRFMLTNKKTRLILLLTVCVSLCIGGIGLLMYSEYRKALDSELNTPNVQLLQINLDVMNRAFHESDSKAVDATFHPAVLEYIRSQASDNAADTAGLQAYLKTLATQPDIQSVEVIRFQDRAVLSSQYGFKAKWEDAPDGSWIPWITDLQKKPLLVKRRQSGIEGTSLGKTELLSLARPIVQDGEVTGAVLVNLDYDRFFSKIYTHLSNYQYVYNLEGDLIYPKLNLYNIPLSDMNRVIEVIDVRPFAYAKVEGQEYMANQTFSDVTGWRLVSLVPMEQLLKNVKLARNMMLLLSVISILVGWAAMYYYNYAAFRPLKRINKLLHPLQKADKQGDLHDLEPVIGKLVGEFHNKSIVAEKSLPELRSKLVQDILTRSIGSQEMHTKREQYFPDWSDEPLLMVSVSIDRYWHWSTDYMEEDRMLLKYAMNNIVLEMLETSWRAVSFPVEKDSLAVLLQAKETEHLPALRDESAGIIQRINEYLHVSVSIGIGSAVSDIQHITQAYADAGEALSYRLYAGYGQVQEYDTLELLPEESANPVEKAWIAEVLNGLQTPDQETALQWIRRWAGEMRKKPLPPQRVYRAADDLIEELSKLVTVRNLTPPAELADYTWHQVSTMELSEIEGMLSRIVTGLADQLGRRRQTKEFIVVQSMLQYMGDHLQENIGLQDIADHVRLGISSVSTIFKEETGTTVYDYLTTLRIDRACELLKETPMKIADIALQVGYQNENSFIRAFRKNKSITPGKYRETNKSSTGYADPPKPRRSGVFEDRPED
jgi:two-component system, response regulator YesN